MRRIAMMLAVVLVALLAGVGCKEKDKSNSAVTSSNTGQKATPPQVGQVTTNPPTAPPPKQEAVYKGRVAAEWIRDLQDRDVETRREAATALGKIGTDTDVKVLIPALQAKLNDPDRVTQIRVATALVRLQKDPAIVQPMIQVLQNSGQFPDMTQAAIVLAELGPIAKPAIPVLRAKQDEGKREHWEGAGYSGETMDAIAVALRYIEGRP